MTAEKTEFKNIKSLKSTGSVLLPAACGILAMIPVYLWGFPAGADFDNHFRFVLPFYEEINQGNFFPGWLAESNDGFGDARFRFYPPFLYYLLCLFRFLTGDWYFAALSVFTFFSVTGALGVYFWTRSGLSEKNAFTAALLFALVPYHLTQFYQASLLAEYAATALLPFAFLSVEKLMTISRGKFSSVLFAVAGLAGVYSLIVATHLPTTVIASYSLGIYALALTDWRENKKGLVYCSLGISLGLMASSWFWVKMLAELGWIQAGEKVASPYYDYRNNFVFSPFAPPNLNTFYGSLVAALTLGIFLPSIILWQKISRKNRTHDDLTQNFSGDEKIFRRRLFALLILAVGSFLMTTDLSRPIWALVPKLNDIQFPYRWLAITSVVICPILALSLPVWVARIKRNALRAVHLPLLLCFFGALLFSFADLVIDSEFLSRERFNRRVEEIRGARSFTDWLPREAKELKDLQPLADRIDANGRAVTVQEWQSHQKIFTVEAGNRAQARLRIYFYPLWRAFIVEEDRRIQIETARAHDGTLLVSLPPEKATVKVVFVEPARTKISHFTAALGWTIVSALLIIGLIRSKRISP